MKLQEKFSKIMPCISKDIDKRPAQIHSHWLNQGSLNMHQNLAWWTASSLNYTARKKLLFARPQES